MAYIAEHCPTYTDFWNVVKDNFLSATKVDKKTNYCLLIYN
ncbi:MAG: hypothetical protein MRERC_4c097 [Mycoplasmataceae bacterium RC_NB112A]|nr:MAG: hypothetical protein MRERC_4c097 [Mycoplasmataceae bacterium RC_NB112A]